MRRPGTFYFKGFTNVFNVFNEHEIRMQSSFHYILTIYLYYSHLNILLAISENIYVMIMICKRCCPFLM